jgi:hypothetical protein
MALPRGKAPGVEGVPMEFFQKYMNATSMDLWKAITKMFNFRSMSTRLNVSFIVIIPKT